MTTTFDHTQESTMDYSENNFDKALPTTKGKDIREFGMETTNQMMQPFINHVSSKSLLTMVPISLDSQKVSQYAYRALQATTANGPNKQSKEHQQPSQKHIDSDSKQREDLAAQIMYQTFQTARGGPRVDVELLSHFQDVEEVKKSRVQKQDSIANQYKERLAAYKKAIAAEMSFSDQLDVRDPQFVTEYSAQIFANMRRDEEGYQLQSDYLSKVQLPTEVKDTSRAFLVEWIIDVHRKFRLMPETLYVTVFLIDQFLSLQQIKKSQLHILGVTSLLIATKYEEIYPPELKDLLQVSENKFSRAEVLKMELDMLSVLQFQVQVPTSYRFLERFRKLSLVTANDDKMFFFAQYLQEIALLDASLLKYRSSEIAAASLILAARNLKKVGTFWNKEMEKATGMLDAELQVVVDDVRSFVMEVNPKFLTTLKYKFSKVEYEEVAQLAFKFDLKQ